MRNKGDTRPSIETNFLEQDRYRKKQNRKNTYDIMDKRCTRRHEKSLQSKNHIKRKLKKESIYREAYIQKKVLSLINYD